MLGEYYRTIFVSYAVEKNGKKLHSLEPLNGNRHFIYLRLEAPKEGIFDNFQEYHAKQKIF